MGTRADFYIGTGKDAEWIGSVAWDGYEWGEDKECTLMKAETDAQFRNAVDEISQARDDFTRPNQGWPWPWNDSGLTDFTYAFKDGATHVNVECEWPDMTSRKNVALGNRSGLIVFVG